MSSRTLLALTGASLLCSSLAAQAMTADKFYEKTAPSIWRVLSLNEKNEVFAMGSAVVTAEETLVTNCHVIAKAKRIQISQDQTKLDASLQHLDIERDLCQIRAKNMHAPAIALGNSDKLGIGQKIYTLGNPSGLERTLSDGLISGLRRDKNGQLVFIQISAPISKGSSGGGLFDDEGNLIGITTANLDGQNLNLAIPINWLKELVARSNATLSAANLNTASSTGNEAKSGQQSNTATTAAASKKIELPNLTKSDFAELNDTKKLFNPAMRNAYKRFLDMPQPRMFALSGDSWYVYPNPDNKLGYTMSLEDMVREGMQQCQRLHRLCHLYAVNNDVVYRGHLIISQTTVVKPRRVPEPSSFADIDDFNRIDQLTDRNSYLTFLSKPLPRAMAISGDNLGFYSWSIGNDNLDPIERVLQYCQKQTGTECELYAVDNDVVFKPSQPLAQYAKGKLGAIYKDSGYANISDLQAIDKFFARKGYLAFLNSSWPRAIAINGRGGWFVTNGVKPNDYSKETDVGRRAIESCEVQSHSPCKLYAVNGMVVYTPNESNPVKP